MRCGTNRWRYALVLAAAAGSAWTHPASAEVVTLPSLERQALTHRAAVTVGRARTSRARAGIQLARATGRPHLSFDADAAVAPGNSLIRVRDIDGHEYRVLGSRPLGTTGAFSPEPRYGASLALEGTIYDFGRTADRVEAAEAGTRAAEAEASAGRAVVIREVRTAYLDWIVARATAGIAKQAADHARARRKAVDGYVEEGKRPPSDLLTARAEEAQARLDLLEAQGHVGTARLALEHASAVRLSRTAEPVASLLDVSPPPATSRQAPALVALQRRRDAALAEARSHAAGWTPVLAGLAEGGVHGQKTDVFPSYRLGISLSVPLWDGGVQSAQREVARATAAELSAKSSALGRSLASAKALARADWQNADARVKVARQFHTAAEAALDAAEERYRLGDGSMDAVSKARAQETRAALRLLDARAARADAALRLRGLYGR